MKKTTTLIFCIAFILITEGANTETKPSDKTGTSSSVPITATEPSSTSISTTNSTPTITYPTTVAPPAPTSILATVTTTSLPPPKPPVHPWNYTAGNDTAIVQMAAQLVITYNGTNNETLSKKINIPTDNTTQVSGNFTSLDETINISWNSSSGSKKNSVAFHFKSHNKTYSFDSIEVVIQPDDLPNTASNDTLKLTYKQSSFNITLGNSYKCERLQKFNLTRDNAVVGQMEVPYLQIQAFKTGKGEGFGTIEDCDRVDVPDGVAIAVGCILAGLVVIVLAVYLISRRRSQARGYLSM